jgi:hypothetical protein
MARDGTLIFYNELLIRTEPKVLMDSRLNCKSNKKENCVVLDDNEALFINDGHHKRWFSSDEIVQLFENQASIFISYICNLFIY